MFVLFIVSKKPIHNMSTLTACFSKQQVTDLRCNLEMHLKIITEQQLINSMYRLKTLVLDLRSPEKYEQAHIHSAINFYLQNIEPPFTYDKIDAYHKTDYWRPLFSNSFHYHLVLYTDTCLIDNKLDENTELSMMECLFYFFVLQKTQRTRVGCKWRELFTLNTFENPEYMVPLTRSLSVSYEFEIIRNKLHVITKKQMVLLLEGQNILPANISCIIDCCTEPIKNNILSNKYPYIRHLPFNEKELLLCKPEYLFKAYEQIQYTITNTCTYVCCDDNSFICFAVVIMYIMYEKELTLFDAYTMVQKYISVPVWLHPIIFENLAKHDIVKQYNTDGTLETFACNSIPAKYWYIAMNNHNITDMIKQQRDSQKTFSRCIIQ